MKLETTKTVAEIAVEIPRAIPYFEQKGIDYCCGGRQSLQEAFTKAGVAVEEALGVLEGIARTTDGEVPAQWPSLASLIQYLVDKHHAFTREQLILTGKLGSKVFLVHGKGHPELSGVNRVFNEMAEELKHHLLKEERVAFPFLKALEENEKGASMPFTLKAFQMGPQQILRGDHEATGEQLAALRHLTRGFTPPPDACVTFQAFTGLWRIWRPIFTGTSTWKTTCFSPWRNNWWPASKAH